MMESEAQIIEYLGGSRLLKLRGSHTRGLSGATEAGLPLGSLTAFARRFDYPAPALERVLGISERSLFRRRQQGTLPRLVSDRLARLARLTALAVEVLESEQEAYKWMLEPNNAFDGKRPLDLAATDAGSEAVRELLLRMEHSIY